MSFSEIDEAASLAQYSSSLQQPAYNEHHGRLLYTAKMLEDAQIKTAVRLLEKIALLEKLRQPYPRHFSAMRELRKRAWFGGKNAIAVTPEQFEELHHPTIWPGDYRVPTWYESSPIGKDAKETIDWEVYLQQVGSFDKQPDYTIKNSVSIQLLRAYECSSNHRNCTKKENIFRCTLDYNGIGKSETSEPKRVNILARQLAFDERYGVPIAREGLETMLAYERSLEDALGWIRNF